MLLEWVMALEKNQWSLWVQHVLVMYRHDIGVGNLFLTCVHGMAD